MIKEVKDLNPSERVDKKSMPSRWKQVETPIALILSVLALLVSILSYRNSTALRYDVSVNMPPEALATLTETDTGVPAYIVYRDIDDRSLGLSRVTMITCRTGRAESSMPLC
jgi:hypothetical protein